MREHSAGQFSTSRSLRRAVWAGLSIASVCGLEVAVAQRAPAATSDALEGKRVRLTLSQTSSTVARAARRIGKVREARGDSLSVVWLDGGAATLPMADIARLDVSRGRRRFVLRGLIIGAFAGAGAGAIVGALSYSEPACVAPCVVDDEWFGRDFNTVLGAYFGGLGGLLAGGAVGTFGRRESWERVPLPSITSHLRAGATVDRRGPQLRVELSR